MTALEHRGSMPELTERSHRFGGTAIPKVGAVMPAEVADDGGSAQ
jgi:hypothetical protein